jgi:hypothetical protein
VPISVQLDAVGSAVQAVTNPVVVAVDFSSLYYTIGSFPISVRVINLVQLVTISVGAIETETGVPILTGTVAVVTTMLEE